MMSRVSFGAIALAAAMLAGASSAGAVSITFQAGGNVLSPTVPIFENFDAIGKGYALAPGPGTASGIGYRGAALVAPTTALFVGDNSTANAAVYNSPSTQNGEGARPFVASAVPPLSSGNFASVRQGGRFVINFADYARFGTTPLQVFSFALGSVDGGGANLSATGNRVTLYLVDGSTETFIGAQLTAGVADGNQSAGATNGRVTFDARGIAGKGIRGAVFESSVTAFEFDDFAGAVPEPAVWGMMIIGFGMAGFGLRRGRRAAIA